MFGTSITSSSTTSSWYHLPTEIKYIIILYASIGLPHHIIPILFGLVSQEWRAITLSIPSFWREVNIYLRKLDTEDTARSKFENARLWLSRAGTRETTLNVTHRDLNLGNSESTYLDLYQILFKNSDSLNVTRLWLDLHPVIFGCLVRILHSSGETVLRSFFGRLSHAWVWERGLDKGFFDILHPRLASASALKDLNIYTVGWEVLAGVPPSILLPQLERLAITPIDSVYGRQEGVVEPLLSSLTLPSLKIVKLIMEASDWGVSPIQGLVNLGRNSGYSLTHLHIHGFLFDGEPTLLDLLPTLPTLEELDLHNCEEFDYKDLFEALQFIRGSDTPPILPRLQTLRLVRISDDEDDDDDDLEEAVLDTVLSRWRVLESDPIVRLKDVAIVLPPYDELENWTKASKRVLRSLVEEGMNLKFEAGTELDFDNEDLDNDSEEDDDDDDVEMMSGDEFDDMEAQFLCISRTFS